MKACKPVIVALIFSLLLSGCGGTESKAPKQKVFSVSGMSITLTEEFMRKTKDTHTAYFESPDSIVAVLKEEFSLFIYKGIDPENYPLGDYAKFVISENELDAEAVPENGLTTMTYLEETGGNSFTYYITVFKGPGAFWIIQFATYSDNFEKLKPGFVEYAQSVTFKEETG